MPICNSHNAWPLHLGVRLNTSCFILALSGPAAAAKSSSLLPWFSQGTESWNHTGHCLFLATLGAEPHDTPGSRERYFPYHYTERRACIRVARRNGHWCGWTIRCNTQGVRSLVSHRHLLSQHDLNIASWAIPHHMVADATIGQGSKEERREPTKLSCFFKQISISQTSHHKVPHQPGDQPLPHMLLVKGRRRRWCCNPGCLRETIVKVTVEWIREIKRISRSPKLAPAPQPPGFLFNHQSLILEHKITSSLIMMGDLLKEARP